MLLQQRSSVNDMQRKQAVSTVETQRKAEKEAVAHSLASLLYIVSNSAISRLYFQFRRTSPCNTDESRSRMSSDQTTRLANSYAGDARALGTARQLLCVQ